MFRIFVLSCFLFTLNTNAIVVVSQCDQDLEDQIFHTYKTARKEMVSQIRALRKYKKNYKLEKDIKKKVNSSIRVLRCSLARSFVSRVRCNEENNYGAVAYTLGFIGTTIWVNPKYWSYDEDQQRGIMIHELTHKCFVGDADYFWHGDKPEDSNGRSWSGIADTYRYWNDNGVCLPEIDC